MNEKLSSLPSPYALTTDNTELVFVKKDALWRVAHYGERSNVAADAVLLTECRYNAESFGRATLETYPSFGADYGDNDGQMGMCKYGAIQAQHADGNTTIQWRCADAWLAADEEVRTKYLGSNFVLKRSDAFTRAEAEMTRKKTGA